MSVVLRVAAVRIAPRISTVASRRTVATIASRLYEARATATGPGRNGLVSSSNEKQLSLKMSTPKALGGPEDAHNPEQLFAMACFSGALNLVCQKAGKANLAKDAKIDVKVWLGTLTGREGFGLEAEVQVRDFPDEALIQKAHEVCPYSLLMREGGKSTAGKA
ncbi:OsmC/Ohr family [Vararia minispora EC-137]|uniref:OsmC/Ohr family n=1 Tax=Vararia minispora EC-137 TaxID=1314806 RepID=A0ACB8QZZ1_9AGAM|nr:OsmC/Ohr family [Vararia minispora EC-137]